MKIVIDLGALPKKELLKCREDIQDLIEQFIEKHPEFAFPADAISFEGGFLGADIFRCLFR